MAVYAQKIPRNAVRLLYTVPDSHQISHTMIVDFAWSTCKRIRRPIVLVLANGVGQQVHARHQIKQML